MPAFDDPYDTLPLVLTELSPGASAKSPREDLALAGPGQPDQLTLYYDGMCESHAEVNARLLAWTVGQDLTAIAVTAGTWIAGPAKLVSRIEERPFTRIAIPCLGIAKAKPNAVRWFAVSETQGAENVVYLGTTWPRFSAEIIGLGVEISYIQTGPLKPNMAQVSGPATPNPAPSPRPNPWTTIPEPTRHWPDGWFLADRKADPLWGAMTAWHVTDVYRYNYAVTP